MICCRQVLPKSPASGGTGVCKATARLGAIWKITAGLSYLSRLLFIAAQPIEQHEGQKS